MLPRKLFKNTQIEILSRRATFSNNYYSMKSFSNLAKLAVHIQLNKFIKLSSRVNFQSSSITILLVAYSLAKRQPKKIFTLLWFTKAII